MSLSSLSFGDVSFRRKRRRRCHLGRPMHIARLGALHCIVVHWWHSRWCTFSCFFFVNDDDADTLLCVCVSLLAHHTICIVLCGICALVCGTHKWNQNQIRKFALQKPTETKPHKDRTVARLLAGWLTHRQVKRQGAHAGTQIRSVICLSVCASLFLWLSGLSIICVLYVVNGRTLRQRRVAHACI